MNTNLLKEAIAEADAIKKMAIENAKASLNEAFDSKVKSMLAARLAEEADDLEEEYEEGKDEAAELDEKKHKEEEGDDEGYGMEEAEKEMKPEDEAYGKEEDEADEAFDLDEIIAELEKGEKEEEEVMEGEDEEKHDDEESEKEEPKEEEEKEDEMKEAKDEEEENESVDEEIDIAALLAEMEDGEGDEVKEAKDEEAEEDHKDEVAVLEEEMMSLLEKMKAAKGKKEKEEKEKMMEKKDPKEEELQEIKRQAAELAQKVNETNLINAKLLYLNKILRKYNLSEQQKLKVISAFDKATTTKEAKIVHESLDQAFSVKNDNKIGLKESMGFASKAAGTSTKRVINEGVISDPDSQVSRWQKLAGIIK